MAEIGSRSVFKRWEFFQHVFNTDEIRQQSGKSIMQNTMRELLEKCLLVGKGSRAECKGGGTGEKADAGQWVGEGVGDMAILWFLYAFWK